MYILKTPPTHQQLCNSVSLSGVLKLKTGQYNLRHVGSKNLVISVDGNIQKIQTRQSKRPNKKRNQRGQMENMVGLCSGDSETGNSVNKKISQRSYQINKSQVRARILNQLNTQKNGKELYFITITFPPIITEDLGYKYLNNWLTVCRSTGLIRSYLWVAEKQKNSTIHYHIAIPHKIYAPKANRIMTTILCNEVRKHKINWNLQAAKRYNGVDLAKNRKTKRITNFGIKKASKSLATYLTKYISKNTESFKHLAWHCSRDYSNLITKISFTDSELLTCGFELYLKDSILFETEHATFIPWVNDPPPQVSEYLSNINNAITLFMSAN